MGMLSARELKKSGMEVHILDKGRLGQESSWAGGGILSPLHPWRYPDAVNQLAIEGHHLYESLAQELFDVGGVDPEYQRSGLLVLDSQEQQAAKGWAEKWSMQLESLMGADAVAEVCPGVSEKYQSALWLPQIAQMRNPRLVKSARAYIEKVGVTIEENMPVERLLVENQRITGVVANGKTYHSDKVLITGGAWSAEILKDYEDVPQIEPVKGQMILFKGEAGQLKTMLLSESRYLIPRKDGRVLCGSTIEHTGYDKSTSSETRQQLQESAIELFPMLADYPVEHHWAGLRPGSPDGVPVIRQHTSIEGLYINAGHYRNGVILCAASAKKIASLMI